MPIVQPASASRESPNEASPLKYSVRTGMVTVSVGMPNGKMRV